MALRWEGDRLIRKMHRAEAEAVNTTMAACVKHAKAGHGKGAHAQKRFVTRSSDLERSLRIIQPAKRQRNATVGLWGSVGLAYARRIELGFQGKDKLGRVYDQTGFPFLRPAADAEYPKLGDRIDREIAR